MHGHAEAPRKRESGDVSNSNMDGPGAAPAAAATWSQAVAADGPGVPARPRQGRVDARQVGR